MLHLQLTERCVGVVLKDDAALTPPAGVLSGAILQGQVGRSALDLNLRPRNRIPDPHTVVCFIDDKCGGVDGEGRE